LHRDCSVDNQLFSVGSILLPSFMFGNSFNLMKKNDDLSGISYVGLGGISLTCAKAVMSILVSGDDIQKATILTSNNAHGFLLQIGEDDLVAVKSGFSSGYKGEGPSALE
jgi:hypothetical protein